MVDLPLGHTTGPPDEPGRQRALLRRGLEAGHAIDRPGALVDLPFRFRDDGWKVDPLGWSRERQRAGTKGRRRGDTRTTRSGQPVYQSDDDRAAAEAVPADEQCLVCLGIDDVDPSGQAPATADPSGSRPGVTPERRPS